MDNDLIYSLRKHSEKFDLSQQIDLVLLKKTGWLIFAVSIPSALRYELNIQGAKPCAAWKLDQYEVFLIPDNFSPELATLCHLYRVDFALIAHLPTLNKAGFALFDMDSTAIEIECIDEIAKLAGVGKKVSQITARAMDGKLDFYASLQQRVALLKGIDIALLAQISLPMTSGMEKLCASLQHYGWYIGIASGGFSFFSDQLKLQLPLCEARANQLEVKQGKLTGRLVGNIIDAQAKANILQEMAEKYGVSMAQTIAVGDGANDLPMMEVAGLGIAYQAKAAVEDKAKIAIRYADLGGVFCILSASLFLSSLS